MDGSHSTQVLIVGAGPTGLALACHCLRLGLQVRIVDKQAGPSVTSKAIGLQYRVSELLACMGVADRFLAVGGTPTNVNIYSGPTRLVQLKFDGFGNQSGKDAFAPRAIMIPQSETERLLGELLRERGGEVEWNAEFLDFTQTADEVVARIRRADGQVEQITTQFLVSCEGAHSQIRKQAGLSFQGKTYPLAFFMADVELDGPLDHAENHVWMHADGSFAALPFPAPRTWRLFVEVSRQMDRLPKELTLDVIKELMAERAPDLPVTISNPTWISEFRVNCRMVDHYRSGRVFLAGDAAHIHSPTGGQGIATGIQDATNLAWKLGRVLSGAPASLLDTYEAERMSHAREVLKETDRTTTVFFAPTLGLRLLRDLLVLPLLRNRWVQARMFAKLSQLHVNYRDSSLSRQEVARGWRLPTRIQAGDRAPDVALECAATGRRITLFELLAPQRPIVLLGCPSADARSDRLQRIASTLKQCQIEAYLLTAPSEEVSANTQPAPLLDVHGDFRRLYGISGEFLCLIRPDDHVGLIQRPIDETRLEEYLRLLSPAGAFTAQSAVKVLASSVA